MIWALAAFWFSSALILYTYFGYFAWLWIRSRWSRGVIERAPFQGTFSLVMVVRNEQAVLQKKLDNLFALNLETQAVVQIVIVSDGSTDETAHILGDTKNSSRIDSLIIPGSRGKAACLNDAMAVAMGDVVVFTDARQFIEPEAVRLLLENFGDPEVGCASGELMLGDPTLGEFSRGMGMYWKYEKKIREMESSSGSVIGATGALYAVRRGLWRTLPQGTVLDDLLVPMNVLRQGARVVFDSRARAWDSPDLGRHREFSRKVRTLGGNYQLVQLAPWLLSSTNPALVQFLSHKVLRLLIPIALVVLLLASFFLPASIYRAALILQIAIYCLGMSAMVKRRGGLFGKISDAALTFVTLNAAAAVALIQYLRGRKILWQR